jgi:multiple sugar transport system permease protein
VTKIENAGRKTSSAYLFLLPSVAVLGIILLVPIFNGLRLSFFEWPLRNINSDPVFVGLRNYGELLRSEYFRGSVRATLIFTFSVVTIELILGTALALLLEGEIPGLRFFRTLYVLPIMIAPVVVGVVWRFMYHPSYGKINYFLGQLGIDPVGWLSNPDVAMRAVIITDVWQWTPFVFLLVLAGLQGVPKDLSEASRVDGAGYLQTLLYVKLPYISAVIGLTAVLRLIDSFRSLVVIFNMTFGGPGVTTEVLSLHLYKTAFTSQRLGMSSAIAVILLLLIFTLSLPFVLQGVKGESR